MKKEWSPQLLSVLRIVLAYLFIQVGSAKVFAVPAAVMPGGGTAAVGSLPWAAGVIEVVGGTFILLGLLTRPVAFILAGEMAVAYFYGHASHGYWLWPAINMGALAVIYCFLFLYFAAAGPGPWSLDAFLARRRPSVVPVS
ncbi:MAG TPA: DoxX family protein [Gemmatimonadales bacterium]|nr:DoxX family protein [Gemmatimonadales bacterium]